MVSMVVAPYYSCAVFPRREKHMEMEVITLSQDMSKKLKTNIIVAEMIETSSDKLPSY